MKVAQRRPGKTVAAMVVLSTMVVATAVFFAMRSQWGYPNFTVLAVLLFLGALLEVFAVELPITGFAPLSMCVSVALAVSQGASWGAFSMLVSVVLREAIRGRRGMTERMKSAALTFVPAGTCCLTFGAFTPAIDPYRLLRMDHWAVLVAATAVYGVLDSFLSRLCVGDLPADKRAVWLTVRNRERLFGVALVPIGWGMALILRLGATPSRPDSHNLWLLLLAVLPLVALHRALRYLVQAEVSNEVSEVDDTLGRMREELLEFKSQNRALMADLHKRVDEIAILRDMGHQLGASQDIVKTLDIVISMIRKLLIYQSCVIYLVDGKGALHPARYKSPYAEAISTSPLLQLEEPMVNLVMQSKRPVLVSDMQNDNEQRIFNDEKSIMCVPLVVENSIIGVIYVGTLRPGTYNDDHVHMLETLANPAAIAIKSAQLHQIQHERLLQEIKLKKQEQERANQDKALAKLGSELNRAAKVDGILEILVGLFKPDTGAGNGTQRSEDALQLVKPEPQSCVVFEHQEGRVVAKKFRSPYAAYFANYTVSVDDEHVSVDDKHLDGENPLIWVANNKRPLVMSDTKEWSLANIIQRERSVILVPLLGEEGDVIGEIYLGAADPGVYDDNTLNLCQMVATQAALAVQKAILFEKNEGLAMTDGVTGLYTHRYFQERLSEEVRRAERYGRLLSLIMVDTDHFKKFNDTLGHPEGDKLLKEISALLKSYTRDSDLVCRYGGDEFSLILQDTEKDSALKLGERIRDAFQLRFGDHRVQVTASIGVATFPTDARTKAELVAAADAALYRSKQNGRNRVSGASPREARSPAPH